MFTGIIEAVGQLVSRQNVGGDFSMRFATGSLSMDDVALGDSIATNGVCLTVTGLTTDGFRADVSLETLNHTTLGALKAGQSVNLEKALLASGRFGGHMVSGHVDATASIIQMQKSARSWVIEVAVPASLKPYIARKGSITIDGVSLTANELTPQGFRLNIVPHTWQQTIIDSYSVGQKVNLEVDVIARYLEQLLSKSDGQESNLTEDFLRQQGFV